jgi:hypothetical protein
MAGGGAAKNATIKHMFFAFVPSKALKAREKVKRKTR